MVGWIGVFYTILASSRRSVPRWVCSDHRLDVRHHGFYLALMLLGGWMEWNGKGGGLLGSWKEFYTHITG